MKPHLQSSRLKIGMLVGTLLLIAGLFFSEPRVIGLLGNSLLLAGGAAVISVPLGIVLGLLIFRTDLPGRTIGLVLMICAMFVPLYIYAAAWSAGFGQLGWFSFIGDPPRPLLDGWFGAIWVHAMAATPWVCLMVGVASTRIDPTLEECALLDANPLRVFFSVTLRMILPAIFAAILWVVLMTMGEMTVSDIFRVRTFAEEVYLNYLLDQEAVAPTLNPWINQLDQFSISIWHQIAVGIWIGLLALILLAELVPISTHHHGAPALQFKLKKYYWPLTILYVCVIVLILGLPLANLFYKAGMYVVSDDQATRERWSLWRAWQNLIAVPAKYGDSFLWTVAIGCYATLLAMPVSILVAWWARVGRWYASLPAIACFAIGFALPGPTIAVFLILLLDQPQSPWLIWLYDRTLFPPAMAITIRLLPLTVLFCWHAMRSASEQLIEQSRLDGLTPLGRFTLLGLLQNRLSLGAASLLAFVVACSDLTASNLVMPPRVDPLPRRIFGFIHSGIDDQVAVLSLANVLIMLPLILLLVWLVRVESGSSRVDRGTGL
jgi:iron(III) transport system permease protein